MTKKELILEIATKTNQTQKNVEEFLESFIKIVTKKISNDEKINISGFGMFVSIRKKARETTYWKTKEVFQVPEQRVPKFKPSKTLKEAVALKNNN
ncbi:HU family DNA-binding protein [Mesomycoplasma neurolyticum]|uniref:DNA-binding protein HU n=1 Tax=Mesomycoplasma neurolyticum TaxID=2120 RepID=A0A449A667_9BACT|nr:HU family DNA-binding protein [Mesomycoplasma neurolyticum]VEU59712.1 DNA-binding protein HU [Mesomycoplasma neurolyticum]